MREDHIARCQLPSAPARRAMIAAVRLNARAVGVDQKQLRRRAHTERETGFKENAPIGQHIGGDGAGRQIRKRQRRRSRIRGNGRKRRRSRPRPKPQVEIPAACGAHRPTGRRANRTGASHRLRPRSPCAANDPPASVPISANDRPRPACPRRAPSCASKETLASAVAAKPATSGSALPS